MSNSIPILNTVLSFIKNDKLHKNITQGRVKLEKIKLASLEAINDLREHPNDNSLQIAKVLHWDCVVDKNQFKIGEKIIFVVVDAVVPITRWNEYLEKQMGEKAMRVSTIKIRGIHSQGLIMPVNILPEHAQNWSIGTDVGMFLDIKKYEKEIPAKLSQDIIGFFPNFICSPTDEDHGLSNPELIQEVLKNDYITVTQKLDGHSCTIIIENKKIKYVCSRRHILKESERNKFWNAAKKINLSNIDDKLYILQGELMGPGLIKNQLNLENPELFIFQIRVNNIFYSYSEMVNQCENIFNCKYVPHIKDFHVKNENIDVKFLQSLSDQQTLPDGSPAEGIVVRPIDYRSSGSGRPLGFKIINRNYID
jgi:RNA ligase (TIGR02306 family)